MQWRSNWQSIRTNNEKILLLLDFTASKHSHLAYEYNKSILVILLWKHYYGSMASCSSCNSHLVSTRKSVLRHSCGAARCSNHPAISQQVDFRGKVPGDYKAAGVAGAQHQIRITTLHTTVTIKMVKITRQQDNSKTLPVRV